MAIIDNSGMIISTDYQFAKLIDGSLTNAVIPSSVSSIRAYAFYGSSSLLSVNIPSSVKTIGEYAFNNCASLPEVIFPDGIIRLDINAFQNCTSLRKVSIDVATVSFYAFQRCSNLTYVFFRGNSNIQSGYNQDAFTNCNNMRLFDMRNMLSAKDKGANNNNYTFTANNVYLYINVPDNLYNEFVALPNWSGLTLKRWVHSCDVASFEDIQNPIENDYYSLKGDTNYLNPLDEKQIDIRQYVNGAWVEVDIDA